MKSWKMFLALGIVGMFVMPMMPVKASTTQITPNMKENIVLDVTTVNNFDGTDNWGNCPVHDVNLNGHMELLSKCVTNGYQYGGCRVYNVFQLEYGKDTIFSVSGHVYGEIYSPSDESMSQIIISMQIYRNYYDRNSDPWKEYLIWEKSVSGVYDEPISYSVRIPGEEIGSGIYIVAFTASIASTRYTGWIGLDTWADFHTGPYCVEAYSTNAQQEEGPKPDLWWSDPDWEPNPPEKYEDITFSITIHKSGKIKRAFNVQLYLDGEKKSVRSVSPSEFVDDKVRVRLPSFWWPNDRNDHTVKIVIDDTDVIDESNENNNVWTKSLHASISGDTSQSTSVSQSTTSSTSSQAQSSTNTSSEVSSGTSNTSTNT